LVSCIFCFGIDGGRCLSMRKMFLFDPGLLRWLFALVKWLIAFLINRWTQAPPISTGIWRCSESGMLELVTVSSMKMSYNSQGVLLFRQAQHPIKQSYLGEWRWTETCSEAKFVSYCLRFSLNKQINGLHIAAIQ